MYCHLPFLVTAWLFNLICDHYHIMVTIVPLWSTVANNRLILCSFSFVIHFHSFLLCSPPIAACTYFVYKDYVANKARQLISFIQPLFLFVPKFASLPRISISSIRISLPLTTLCGLVFLVSFPLKLCVSLWARVSVPGLHFLCIFIAACARLLHFCVDIVAATLLSLPDSVHHCKNPWTSCVRRCFWFHVFFWLLRTETRMCITISNLQGRGLHKSATLPVDAFVSQHHVISSIKGSKYVDSY